MKQIHFSIDDIGKSLRWLTMNKPNSVFDMRLFGTLKKWHELYDIKVTLYCFATISDFSFDQIPEKYKCEFENNSWLSFGYHGRVDAPMTHDEEYVSGHRMFLEKAEGLGMTLTDIYRIHYWIVTKKQMHYLFDNGVRVLLYPDDDKYPYDGNDAFEEAGLEFWRTRIRFENMDIIDPSLMSGLLTRRLTKLRMPFKFMGNTVFSLFS